MSKIKKLKEENPKFTIDLIDVFSRKDPSGNNKYLKFMVEQTSEWVDWFLEQINDDIFSELFESVGDFEEYCSKNQIKNKDIYSYKSNEDIRGVIVEAKEHVSKSVIKKKETIRLYEDERWLLVQPLTSRSSEMYGKSTKWCVSSKEHSFDTHFNDYTRNGVLIFLIDKNVKEEDTRDSKNIKSKLAFHKNNSEANDHQDVTVWDVLDIKLSLAETMELNTWLPKELTNLIYKTLCEGDSNRVKLEDQEWFDGVKGDVPTKKSSEWGGNTPAW